MKIRKLKRKKSGSVMSVPSELGWNRFPSRSQKPCAVSTQVRPVPEEHEHEPDQGDDDDDEPDELPDRAPEGDAAARDDVRLAQSLALDRRRGSASR